MLSSKLAIDGGTPVRPGLLPYGRQSIDEDDIAAVTGVLRSDWLTTGPAVCEFERAFAQAVGAREAIAVSSGTAALHAAMHAIGIGAGDEVLVPAMTFVASANSVVFQGGTPVFVDVIPDKLLIDPADVERRITPRTKAIVAVDFAGQPCDYNALHEIAARRRLALVADACHALGARYQGRPAGSLADITAFSLHPVKHITTGEGGMVTTDDRELARRLRLFRNHGITVDHRQREKQATWLYEVEDLGYNYRLTDMQCALGLSQLRKLPGWLTRRRQIARCYDEAFAASEVFRPLGVSGDVSHAYHLYVVRLGALVPGVDRATIFRALRAEGIGVNVHYIPVHYHPFYRKRFATRHGLCPAAEAEYERILSLPIFATMADTDVADVIAACHKVSDAYQNER